MNVYIQLLVAGTDTGPFDLYSNIYEFASAFETGVTRDALVAGYISTVVPDGTTQIKIQSTGNCDNSIIVYVGIATTTTTTNIKQLHYNIPQTECSSTCPTSEGNIDVEDVSKYLWMTSVTTGPQTGTIAIAAGDVVHIHGTVSSPGDECNGVGSTISIQIGGVEVASNLSGIVDYLFVMSEDVTVDIITGCVIK